MLSIIIILSLLNTTLIHCAKKWGWIDLLQAYGWVKKVCYLCTGFWMAVFEFIFVFVVIPESLLIEKYFILVHLTPFCSAAITNYLVNIAIMNDNR